MIYITKAFYEKKHQLCGIIYHAHNKSDSDRSLDNPIYWLLSQYICRETMNKTLNVMQYFKTNTMVTIRDIYQWYENKYSNEPQPKTTLTPLRKIEWEEQNSQVIADYWNSYKTKSFIGEILSASAYVTDIKKNNIEASVPYYSLHSSSKIMPTTVANRWSNGVPHVAYHKVILAVKYDLIFDNLLYEQICLLHKNSMIEFAGEILSFSEDSGYSSLIGMQLHDPLYLIKLKLSSIKIIKAHHLHEDLLHDIPNNKTSCFIATAAFGSQDIYEVIQLREYRDNVLRNSFAGKSFIHTYYIISPPIAFIIKQSSLLRKITRNFLKIIVLPIIIKNNS